MAYKTCFKCNISKDETEFYRHKAMADGRLGKCKGCTKMDVQINYRLKIDKYKEYDRARANSPHRVLARKEYSKTEPGRLASSRSGAKWRMANKKKRKAINAVNNAVRDGRIEKRSSCEKCGKEGLVHGHHDDYDKPLEVRWLCPSCHISWHRVNGPGLNAFN